MYATTSAFCDVYVKATVFDFWDNRRNNYGILVFISIIIIIIIMVSNVNLS